MSRALKGLLAIAFCLMAVGCNQDSKINATMSDIDVFTADMVKKVESAKDPSTGVDEAQKYLDSKSAELKAKMNDIKNVRGFQVSEEAKKKMTESITRDVSAVMGLQIKYVQQTMKDPKLKVKLEKLTKDYQAIFTM